MKSVLAAIRRFLGEAVFPAPPRQLELKVSRQQLRGALAEMLASPQGRELLSQCLAGAVSAAGADPSASQVTHGRFGEDFPDDSREYVFQPKDAATTPLTVQGAASQSAALQNWKDSVGKVLATVDAAGNVGIGTANPGARLEVNGGDIKIQTGTVGQGRTLIISDNIGGAGHIGHITAGGGVTGMEVITNSNGDLYLGAMGATRALTVKPAGNVGMGTTEPSAKLTVAGDGSSAYSGIPVTNTVGNASFIHMSNSGPALHINAGYLGWLPLILNEGGGNVGIGTTEPSAKLTVAGDGSSAYSGISVTNTVGNASFIHMSNSGPALHINAGYLGWLPLILNEGGGNVGIGTTAPAEKLDVAGKMRASGDHPILIDPTAGGLQLPDMDPPGDLYAATKQYVDNKVAGTFNVKEFGATGGGTTDDTDAIQAAIGAAHDADGGVVFFPPGTYLIGNLTGASKIQLRGAGAGATTLVFNGSSGNMIEFNGKGNFSVRNIQWDWKGVARDQGPVLITDSSFFDISDCSFVNLGGPPSQQSPPPAHWGVHVQVCCHDFRIERNYFKLPAPYGDAQNNAILAATSNGIINANHCDGSGIIISGHDLKVTSNVIHGFKYGSGIVAGPDSETYGLEIIGNTVYDGTGLDKDGTWCAGIENWAPRSVIGGNICHDCVGNGIANGGQRCTVTNNICYDNGNGTLPPAWTNRKAAAVWEQVQPTNPYINHRYVCTVAGSVGDTEPNWPTDPGATVQDGSAVWKENGPRAAGVPTWTNRKTPYFGERVRPTTPNTHRYKCIQVGPVGDTEPSWPLPNPPTDPHPTVQDGSAIWQHDAPDANPDLFGIAIQSTGDFVYNSSESVYAGNRCFDSGIRGGVPHAKTQQYGIGDEWAALDLSDVTIGINNLSGNASAELRILRPGYTILATSGGKLAIGKPGTGGAYPIVLDPAAGYPPAGVVSASGAADVGSLKISGTQVISDQRVLQNVTGDADIITSGVFSADRIPSLDAAKIGSGTLNSDRIPSLDASKIGSGVINDARLPDGLLRFAASGRRKIAWAAVHLSNGAWFGDTGLSCIEAAIVTGLNGTGEVFNAYEVESYPGRLAIGSSNGSSTEWVWYLVIGT